MRKTFKNRAKLSNVVMLLGIAITCVGLFLNNGIIKEQAEYYESEIGEIF